MSIFIVSFRVADDETGDQRRASVVDAIEAEAAGSVWDETTSFVILESAKNSRNLVDDIYFGSDALEDRDTLLVINLSKKAYAFRGLQYEALLKRLMDKR